MNSQDSARQLLRQGRLAEAERLYRDALERTPRHVASLQGLSEVCYRTGRVSESAELLCAALEAEPQDAQMLSNVGAMLYQLGRSTEALPFLEKSLAIRPASALTLTNLGNVLAALGRSQEAIASYEKSATLDPSLAEPHNNIGNVLAALGRYDEAVAAFRTAVSIKPAFADAWSNLGNALFKLRRHADSIACFERAVALKPDSAQAHYNWGTVLADIGLHDDAVGHYRRAMQLRPSYAAANNNLGRSCNALGKPDDALAAFEAAAAADPGFALAHAGIGSTLLYLGKTKEARAACERAVALGPGLPATHRALSELKRYAKDDPQIAQMEAIRPLDDTESAELHFALGKAYADCGEHERAFAHFLKGNAAKRRLIAYDEGANLEEMRATAATFTRALLEAKRGAGNPSERPIFIIGMPRSGTTLVEQILASHPMVYAVGEQPAFGLAAVGSYRPSPLPFDVAPVDLARLGSEYLARMAAKVPQNAPRFTDKMPANFRFAGLIHLALPNARIIHVERDPLDTCVSCFTKLFTGSLEFTYDLAELGRYYKAYERLMRHWREVLPSGAMLDVHYEELVDDFEAKAKAIVAFCGLPWDARCLEFHKTDRAVMTASTAQVRQPLFKNSVGRWRVYEEWLGPLREALNEGTT